MNWGDGTRVRSRSTHVRTGLALLAAAALTAVASGCGARWTDDQTKVVAARDSVQRTAGTGSEVAAGGEPGETTTTLAGDVSTGDTVPGATGDGGDTGGVADPSTAGGPLPCAAPSTAPGVTDDKIVIGNISTQSGPIPGLGATAVAATRGYIAYLNSMGGICGRKVELKTADDGLDNSSFRSILTKMEPTILGLVGQNGGGDAGGADLATAKNMPAVTAAFSTPFQNAPTVFDVNPPFRNTANSIGKYKWLYSQGVRKAALVYGDVAQSKDQIKNAEQPLIEAAGIKVVADLPQPLSTLNYDSAARSVANSGADYMMFLGAYEQNSNMAKSMAGTGYKGLKFTDIYTAYGTNYIDLARAAAEGTVSFTYSLPVEDGTSNPELVKFLKWLKQTSPGATPDVFATQAWVSSKAFFDTLLALPGPISREAIIKQLRTLTSFDAGGFTGRFNLAEEANGGCQIGMKVVNGKWQRLHPATGFLC